MQFHAQAQYSDDLVIGKGTFFGGASNVGYFSAMATDSQGYVYGLANGNDFPATAGAYKTSCSGPSDLAVFKLSPDLRTLIWCSYLGGVAGTGQGGYNDIGTDIAVTTQGEVVVAGWTCSNDFPVSSGANYCTSISSSSSIDSVGIFVTKFSASGSSLVFSRIVGYTHDPSQTQPKITLSPQNEIFLVTTLNTYYSSIPLPPWDLTANAFQSTLSGDFEIAIVKLSSAGATLYGSYLGGATNLDISESICYAKNKVYISGRTDPRSSSNQSNFPMLSLGEKGEFVLLLDDAGTNLNFRKCVLLQDLPGPSRIWNGVAYDYAVDEVNVTFYLNRLYVLDSSLSQLRLSRNLTFWISSGAPSIVIANGRRKYLTTQNSLLELDSTTNATLFLGFIPGVPTGSFSACRAIVRPGSDCNYSVLLGLSTNSTAFRTTPDVYQPLKMNGATQSQPGISMLMKRQVDSVRFRPLPLCGSFFFRDSTHPCKPTSVRWDFSDGTPSVIGTDTVTHTFKRNGMYTVSMRAAYTNRDTVFRDTTIFIATNPIVKASPQTLYRCSNDSSGTSISASGAVRYEWHPGATLSDSTSPNPKAKPQKNMKYYVRGYDANGCYADDSVQVYVSTVKATVNTLDTTICEGSSVNLKAAGAGEYKWFPATGLNATNTANVVARPNITTDYSVVASEAGCRDTAHVKIRVAHRPKLALSPAPIVCTGGTARLFVNAVSADSLDTLGMSYRWTPTSTLINATSDSPSASPLTSTWYRCVATNKYGCVSIDSVEVKVQTSLNLVLSPDTLTCLGSSLNLKASGGALYSWSPRDGLDDSTKATPVCTPTKRTRYTVMTWSGDFATASCRDTAVLDVDVYPFPRVKAQGATTVCKNTAVQLIAVLDSNRIGHNGIRIVWMSMSGQELGYSDTLVVRPDTTTSYMVAISNAQGCRSYDTLTIQVATSLSVQARTVAAVLPGTLVQLSVQNADTSTAYTWFDSTRKIIGSRDTLSVLITVPGWYYVHGERSGCEGWDSVYVGVTDLVRVQACQDVSLCKGQTTKLFVVNTQPNTVYTWKAESGSWTAVGDTVQLVADMSQRYIVQATKGVNSSSDTVFVRVYDLPQVLVRDTMICEGSSVTLEVLNHNSTHRYEWRDAAQKLVATTPSYATSTPGSYTITATNEHGCLGTAHLLLTTKPRPSIYLSIAQLDTVRPGALIQIPIYASASMNLSQLRIVAQLHVPSSMLWIQGATVNASESLYRIDTTLDLTTSPTRIANCEAQVLVNQILSAQLTLAELQSSLQSDCSVLSATPQQLEVSSACANTWFKLQYSQHSLQVLPNPSKGDVEIQSSGDVRVFSSIGDEVRIDPLDCYQEGTKRILHLRDLPAGLYFARMTEMDVPLIRSFVVCN